MKPTASGSHQQRTTTRRRVLQAAGASGAVGLTGLTGCLGGGDLGSGDGPIRIGAVQPFSGAFSSYSEPHQRGLEYAIEQINSEGGVLGRELDYVSEDSQSDPGQAASIFQRFVEQEDVAAVTGVVSSDVGIRTAQTAEQEEVPNILHVAASNEVLSKDSRYNFRTAMMATPNVGKAHADLIEDHGFTKIGGLMADYAAGDAIGEATERYVGNLDGVETHMEFAPLGESDFTSYLRQIPDDIDMMIASGHPPGAPTIISQQIELGTNPEMTTTSINPGPGLYSSLGDNIDNGTTSEPLIDPESQGYIDLATQYNEDTGERMVREVVHGYGAVQLIAEAIRRAESANPQDIAGELRGGEFELAGWSGPVKYTDWGELDDVRQVFVQYEEGAPEYYPDGEWTPVTHYVTDPIEAFDPDDW